jgi:hypothetical protein
MAKGTLLVFDATPGYLRDKDVDIASGSWKCALISDPVTSLLVSETGPALGSTNINEVTAGGAYTAGGQALTLNNSDSGGVVTMKLNTTTHTGGKISWARTAGSPTNIKSAVIYDDNATTPVNAAICYIDLTEDGGTTAIDLSARDIEITFGTGGSAGDILNIQTSN